MTTRGSMERASRECSAWSRAESVLRILVAQAIGIDGVEDTVNLVVHPVEVRWFFASDKWLQQFLDHFDQLRARDLFCVRKPAHLTADILSTIHAHTVVWIY